MKVVYYKLFDMLKEKRIMQKTIKDDLKLGGNIMQKLRHNETVTTETIGKICQYLQCQPNDIMEVIPDEDIIERQKQKADVEAQIAELQKKLKSL